MMSLSYAVTLVLHCVFSILIPLRMAKVLFVTTPIRPTPTPYPPMAVLSIMKAARKHGYLDAQFYNIDYLRPPLKEAVEHIRSASPDILAISAVVSTAYAYVKQLTNELRKVHPRLTIILGGPLGASSEIILKKTAVDFICLSEGEIVFPLFLAEWEKSPGEKNYLKVPGLAFCDDTGTVVTSGYAPSLEKEELFDFDFDDLTPEQLDHYMPIVGEGGHTFGGGSLLMRADRVGMRSVEIPGSKGCVAKCTFCHRWDKGIRYIPPKIVIERITELKERFNIGMFRMSDENFGTDKQWLSNFCELIKPLDVLWEVGGMRVNCISAEQLKNMKEAGCVACYFGMETGSRHMLKVMNKGVKLEDNYEALRLMHQCDLPTTIMLVVGMPGETDATVAETAEFLRFGSRLSERRSPFLVSINYAQALPGTPLYEYAREAGFIGKEIDSEENYLIWMSDKNAADDSFVLDGLSGRSRLETLSWRPFLIAASADAYLKKFGYKRYYDFVWKKAYPSVPSDRRGYFTKPHEDRESAALAGVTEFFSRKWTALSWVKIALNHPIRIIPALFFRSKAALYFFVVLREIKQHGLGHAARITKEYYESTKKPDKDGLLIDRVKQSGYQSLRKVVSEIKKVQEPESEVMELLRKGRW
jgi:anaerobic magnesium-protoporphyrin IX monomethyl ester cyclase